ncbi:zinc ABC transporter substrate-binding protein [Marivita sp. S6314]|uniref:zinc ABC transporter substrate-binding protein n=1 Tax=Marivita sp. S6314 TaxID=2926406 RepID=UPI001FF3984A|nr:zinc ABC transporter substrate-binding protein [Marivita sp. S6314]MCK0150204.1 zinc ABC transporter substrate-binding protein [Marivita sp. S6314]
MIRITSLALVLTSTATLAHADMPRIATDIAPVHGLVSMVTGDQATPSLLIDPSASPHTNAMRPSTAAALQEADVVFWMGDALTPWLETPIETLAPDARHSALLSVEGATLRSFRDTAAFGADEGHDDHDHGDHAHDEEEHNHNDDHAHSDDHAHDDDHAHEGHEHEGHDHDGTDPHAWLDPANAQVWLTHIAAILSEIDPDNAATYTANASAAKATVAKETDAARARLAPLQGKPFVVFHDAYHYFEAQFGLSATGALSLSDAVPPSPSHVAEIQARIRDQNVVCVFSEPQYSDRLVQTVIDRTDARTVELDPLGAQIDLGAAFYPALLRDMTTRFAECLQ